MNTPRFSLALVFAFALPALGYEHALSDTSVRNAYYLGAEKNSRTAAFRAGYIHNLQMPKAGPYVSKVTMETPLFQAVDRSGTALNYSGLDAEQEFAGKAVGIRVRIEIDLTATYTQIVSSDARGAHYRSGNFWRDFTFKLMQSGKEIPVRKIEGAPIYTSNDDGSILSGAIVTLEYRPNAIASDYTTVEVLTPDGQVIKTAFDLAKLR